MMRKFIEAFAAFSPSIDSSLNTFVRVQWRLFCGYRTLILLGTVDFT